MIESTGCHEEQPSLLAIIVRIVFAFGSLLIIMLNRCLTLINTVLIMSLKNRSLEVTPTGLGYHVYQKIWNPEIDYIMFLT